MGTEAARSFIGASPRSCLQQTEGSTLSAADRGEHPVCSRPRGAPCLQQTEGSTLSAADRGEHPVCSRPRGAPCLQTEGSTLSAADRGEHTVCSRPKGAPHPKHTAQSVDRHSQHTPVGCPWPEALHTSLSCSRNEFPSLRDTSRSRPSLPPSSRSNPESGGAAAIQVACDAVWIRSGPRHATGCAGPPLEVPACRCWAAGVASTCQAATGGGVLRGVAFPGCCCSPSRRWRLPGCPARLVRCSRPFHPSGSLPSARCAPWRGDCCCSPSLHRTHNQGWHCMASQPSCMKKQAHLDMQDLMMQGFI